MQLVPTPLPTALTQLLTSAARVSGLVYPAFGISPNQPCSPSSSPADVSTATTDDNTNSITAESNEESSSSRDASRAEQAHRRKLRADRNLSTAVSLLFELGNAVSILEQLRRVADETGLFPWG